MLSVSIQALEERAFIEQEKEKTKHEIKKNAIG